jgi:hypothetical protein
MTIKVLLFATALLAACRPAPPPPEPPVVIVVPDAASPPTCDGACQHMRELGCELGKPTPRGATCEQVCVRVQVENGGAGFDFACLTRAGSCADADSCR